MTHDDLWAVLYAPGFFQVSLDNETRWLPAAERDRFRRTLGGAAKLATKTQIHPAPRGGFDRRDVASAAVLWVRAESGDESEALLSWSPKPTVIIRDGETVKHTALWALTRTLDPRWTERLNKRLAHAIGTAKKHASPETFHFTAPGSLTETGKVAQVVHASPDFYGAKELAGRLPDAPDTKALYKARQERMAA